MVENKAQYYTSNYGDFLMKQRNVAYTGYMLNDPEEAIRVHHEKTGFEATVIVAHPDFELRSEHPLIVRSRWGAANAILVSHMVTPSDVRGTEDDGLYLPVQDNKVQQLSSGPKQDYAVPKKQVGRPKKSGSVCPHCQGAIGDFNDLGFWYGWSMGIEPPYWDDLKRYVFNRDDHTCHTCHTKFPIAILRAHHISPKEIGGTDSARNLQTLCSECHLDEHPIYPEEE